LPSLDFKGSDALIQRLDAAVQKKDPDSITSDVRDCLCNLITDGAMELPDFVLESKVADYARRLIYESPEHGYTVVAMTWGPNQGTPVHDHCGMWCVEAVCYGQIEVTQYELVDRKDELFQLEPRGSILAGIGSAGALIPPHEYHSIANPRSDSVGVTLHIYSGDMCKCNAFEPLKEHWYRRSPKVLSYD